MIRFQIRAPRLGALLFAFVILPTDYKDLARSDEWLNLLHYRHLTLSGVRSEIDSQKFFLDKNGQRDAEAEFVTSWQKLQSSESLTCDYPARVEFFNRRANLNISLAHCQHFQEWRRSLKIESVSVVFTAPYFGSPASLFGHTFLKLNPSAVSKDSLDPLAQVISFEAITGDSRGAGYAVQGVLGMFPGMYTQQPYFVRTNLYTNIESRDIWEYELNLTEVEIDRLLMHLWELREAHNDYYFFDENCSYNLLPLFEVARPGLRLRNQFYLKTIPIDTARAITKEFQVKSVHYRPSLMKQFHDRYEKLTSKEKKLIHNWLSGDRELIAQIKRSDTAAGAKVITGADTSGPDTLYSRELLDTLIDAEKYATFKEAATLADRSKEINHQLLMARSRLGPNAQSVRFAKPTDPILGHSSSKISLGVGESKKHSYLNISYRAALHDTLDLANGHLERSTLVVLNPEWRWFKNDELPSLSEFTFANVETYAPSHQLETRFAWQLSAKLANPDRLDCTQCLGPELTGAYGYNLQSFYLLARARTQIAKKYLDQDRQVDVGPELGLLFYFSEKLKTQTTYNYYYAIDDLSSDTNNYSKWSVNLSYSFSHPDIYKPDSSSESESEVRCTFSQISRYTNRKTSWQCALAKYF